MQIFFLFCIRQKKSYEAFTASLKIKIMKNKQEKFQLINSTYSPFDAAEVLFSLVRDKIKFHNMLLFSNEERFGVDNSHSRKRIEELKKMRDEIAELIRMAEAEGFDLEVSSHINITLKERVKETV